MNVQVKYSLFETEIYKKICDLDLEQLWHRCQQHQSQQLTTNRSNRGGGYQGHLFNDSDFNNYVIDSFPRNPSNLLPPVWVQAWVNINGPGAWNALHNHLDTDALLSGVFYVKAPPNSGNIMFYDPRYLSSVGNFYRYYAPHDQGYVEIQPEPNMMLFFPPSLFHMVGPNLTHDTRCSIAFNIMVASNTDIK